MKLCTPAIAWHNRERVASVDFQPRQWPEPEESGVKRVRVASGGDDHHVVIWEVGSDEEGKAVLRPLCDLSRHQNSVNAVRWAPDGKILASADTDCAVFLWQFNPSAAVPDLFGEDGGGGDDEEGDGDGAGGHKENWSILRILRGHLQDVIGLAFSPDGAQICSCSTDGSAIVFDVHKGTKLKILSDHKGWVNGVAWDPLGESVVTLASDRVLRVFKHKSFKVRCKTSKCQLPVGNRSKEDGEDSEKSSSLMRTVRLFHDDTFPSFFRRADFSPDGEILAVPSGVLDVDGEADKPTHCTYLFSRMDYSKPVLSLPHREYSVAVRFSPVKYKLRDVPVKKGAYADASSNAKPWEKTKTLFCLPYRMVYAVATQNAVTLHDTQQAEPFARVSKIHYIALTDLSWSSDGSCLVVSSTDGFCSIISFREGEIGEVYAEEKEEEKENVAVADAGSKENTAVEKVDPGAEEAARPKKGDSEEVGPNAEKSDASPEAETILAVRRKPVAAPSQETEEAPMEVDHQEPKEGEEKAEVARQET